MKPIRRKDLSSRETLTRPFFRAVNPHLDQAAFDEKWQEALRSPTLFFRSFAQAYYLDVGAAPASHVPGKERAAEQELICFGDAHPDNFGYLRFADGPHYVYNDLDDADLGVPALDALRYFTALWLRTGSEKRVARTIDHYHAALTGPDPALPLPGPAPDLDAERARGLAEEAPDGRLRRDEDSLLVPVDPMERTLLMSALSAHPWLAQLQVHDLAERRQTRGGSSGLRRFWVLVHDPAQGAQELIELKEETVPAISWGDRFTILEDRVRRVKHVLWAGLEPRDHFTVVLGQTPFLVRCRLGRQAIDLDGLDKDDRAQVFAVQARQIARVHAAYFSPAEAEGLGAWLLESARVLAERYLAVWKEHRRAGG